MTINRASYLADLNDQWLEQYAHTPATYDDGTPWGTHMPALAGCATLQDVRDRLHVSPIADANKVLHALLVVGREGSDAALRTVLQTELGVVVWLDRQAAMRGVEDHFSVALEAMWATIRAYPLHRSNVAANLKMDALKRLARSRQVEAPADTLTLLQDTPAAQAAGLDPLEQARHLMAWARAQHVLSKESLEIIERMHLAPTPVDYASIAQETGVQPAALRQRYSRGVRQLAAAVRDAIREDALATDLAEVA